MKKNDEVLSLEQMRILLHISKRKAAWMLQNQVIPCIVNDQMTTHKYMVRREDVDAFLRLPAAEQQARIPVGQFTSGYQCKPVRMCTHILSQTPTGIVSPCTWTICSLISRTHSRSTWLVP